MIGRVLEKYEILDKVGQGGMAVVYRGLDTTLGREVAVKVLHPHLAELEESRLRLQREAQAVAKLHHENILEIFAYSGLDSTESFIVTEFIHGQTLRDFLKDSQIPLPEIAAMIVHEICRALGHAHSLGVIHRDIKPENIMIRSDGLLKLMDFGIAQIIDKQRMTITGQILGSPAYMAPEQVEGKSADYRTDVFAVGILLYQLATGELPFVGKNPHEVLKKIAEGKFRDPEAVRPEVGGRLSRLMSRALARAPEHRFAEISHMLEELRGYLEESGVTDPRAELNGFFPAPQAYVSEFRPRLVASLTANGEQALAAGRTARALELFNRVLLQDPHNARVARAMARLSRRRIARRVFAFAAAGLVTSALAIVLVHAAPWHTSISAPGPVRASAILDAALSFSAAADAVPASAASPDAAPGAVHDSDAAQDTQQDSGGHRSTDSEKLSRPRHPPLTASAAPTSRTVSLEILPPNAAAVLRLDGRLLGPWRAGDKLAVGPGAHVLVVSAPAFYDVRVPLPATGLRPALTVPLRWKPAQVIVNCEAPGASVHVSTRAAARNGIPGAAIAMPVPNDADSGEFTVEVAVSASGYRNASTTVRLHAGQTSTVTLPLRRVE
jgi:tRNA A-37 threonylcarbamoyl transferase component Bud32